MNRVILTALSVLVLAGIPSAPRSQVPDPSEDYTNLSKPLDRFTMEDLIFVRPESANEIALYEDWIQASQALMTKATFRGEAARRAIDLKRQEIETLKVHKKQAEQDKNRARAGEIAVTIASEEQAVKILERIAKLALLDQRAAESWREWCMAMKKGAEASLTVDAYRTAQVADSPLGGPAPGLVLEPRALQVYREHTEAYAEVGDEYVRLGSDIQKLMKERKKFLQDLERGGLVAIRR